MGGNRYDVLVLRKWGFKCHLMLTDNNISDILSLLSLYMRAEREH